MPRTLKSLIASLNGPVALSRWRAVKGIVEYDSEEALDALIQALSHEDSILRRDVADAIGQYKNPKAVEPLIHLLLNDSSGAIRCAAARSLGEIGDQRAVEPLLGVMMQEDNVARSDAAGALSKIGDARAILPLAQRRQFWLLVPFGQAAIPELLAALKTVFLVEIAMGKHTEPVQELGVGERRRLLNYLERVRNAPDPILHPLSELGWTPQTLEEKIAVAILQYDTETLVNMGAEAVPALVNVLNSKHQAAIKWRRKLAEPTLLQIGTPEAVAAVKAWRKTK